MRARVLLVVLMAVAVVGCGPKPTPTSPPTGEPGSGPVATFDGTWTITKVEAPDGVPAPKEEDFAAIVAMVKGNLITARHKESSNPYHLAFEIDAAANPNVITFIESDEKGETGPRKTPATQFGGKVVEMDNPRFRRKAILAVNGDTAKLAIDSASEGPTPTEFVPKETTKADPNEKRDTDRPLFRTGVVVIHLKRVKDTPEWATKPPPPRPTPTTGRFVPSTGPIRANPPTSAPNTGK